MDHHLWTFGRILGSKSGSFLNQTQYKKHVENEARKHEGRGVHGGGFTLDGGGTRWGQRGDPPRRLEGRTVF